MRSLLGRKFQVCPDEWAQMSTRTFKKMNKSWHMKQYIKQNTILKLITEEFVWHTNKRFRDCRVLVKEAVWKVRDLWDFLQRQNACMLKKVVLRQHCKCLQDHGNNPQVSSGDNSDTILVMPFGHPRIYYLWAVSDNKKTNSTNVPDFLLSGNFHA